MVGSISQRIASLERRMENVEAALSLPKQSPPTFLFGKEPQVEKVYEGPVPPVVMVSPSYTPPPVSFGAQPPPMPSVAQRLSEVAVPEQLEPVTGPKIKNANAEYEIGAKLLPRVGAGLVLLGVLFFVIWGYANGWITPLMVLTGEILFCLSFIVVGIMKRDLGEDFGKVLVGIGSGGLYLSLAGGHLFQHLYSGEILVGLFMALSFANFAYSYASASKSLWSIGMVGGLAGALLPLRENHFTLNVVLHFLILVPAAGIALKNKWSSQAVWLFGLSTVALAPFLTAQSVVGYESKVAAIYGSTVLCLAAYICGYRKSALDPDGLVAGFMVFSTGAIGYFIFNEPVGAVHLLLFGVTVLAVSWLVPGEERVRKVAIASGAFMPMVVAPYCFPTSIAVMILGVTAILASLASLRYQPKLLTSFGGFQLGLGFSSYLIVVSSSSGLYWGREVLLLVSLIFGGGAVAYAFSQVYQKHETFGMSYLIGAAVLVSRLLVVLFENPAHMLPPEASVLLGTIAFGGALCLVSRRTGWRSSLTISWVVGVLIVWMYCQTASDNLIGSEMDAVMLMLMIGVFLAMVNETALSGKEDEKQVGMYVSAITISSLTIRLGYVILHHPKIAVDPYLSTFLPAVVVAMVSGGIALARKAQTAVVAAWTALVVGGAVYCQIAQDNRYPLRADFFAITLILVSFVFLHFVTSKVFKVKHEVMALIGWPIFCQWFYMLVLYGHFDIHASPSITVAWTIYGIGALALGMVNRLQTIRYVGLGVLASAVAKVLLVDLATTDAAVRVLILVGLGLALLLGGYWYIRSKDALKE